jgi:membrane protein YdbS with pleckstrin-like domain
MVASGGCVPPDREGSGSRSRVWLMWLRQAPSLVYLAAGAFLVYLYWKHLHRQAVLVCGVLFMLYSIYRFFLVRRGFRRRGADDPM